MQKGFAPIFILVGILVIGGIAGGAYYFGKTQTPKPQVPQITSVPSSAPDTSPVPNGTGENVNADASRSANWKIYTGSKFLIQYPSNLVITPSGLIEVIESVQFGEKDKEETNYIRVSASSGGETTFKNRKETYLTYGIYNPKQEELFVGGLNAWRYSGTDADGSNFRQHVLFYKDDLGFEIDNFGINKNIFDQILSTFKFTN